MRKGCLMAILTAWPCLAQTDSPGSQNLHAIQANLKAAMRGTQDYEEPAQPDSPLVVRPVFSPPDSSVTVIQLKHKPSKSAQKIMARGAKFSLAGDHWRAAEQFERAVAGDPGFAKAYERLGVEYAQSGRFGEAELMLRRSIVLDSADWSGYYDLGVLLSHTDDLQCAEQYLRRALQLSKTDARVHLVLALLLLRSNETSSEGLEHLRFAARTIQEAKELLTSLQKK